MDTYEHVDPEFRALIIGHAQVEKLWTGGRWLEGPVYWPGPGILVYSDIPNNRMLRWSEGEAVSVFRRPSNNANGNTLDGEGRLVTCEHGARRVTRTEHDGSITVLADRVDGQRFNSPNDVVVARDGSVWFSDPDYGIKSDYEGDRSASEIGSCDLYRIAPDGGVTRVRSDFEKPNGLAFSPDESILYVSDTGSGDGPQAPPHIRAFEVGDDGALSGGSVFAVVDPPASDGFRIDEHGNLWTSAGDGVHCFAPDGRLLGKVLVPERVSNVAFGGPKRNRLFITATTSLYSIYLGIRGA
ncbi:MAG TPA: SMP-30/gluconolactonase/LRE family protein [Spirochaetia bacterium]|nr:SMP-30/gluconolactonase/LRE family protein [Spirochaetia bacterium]